MTVLSRRRFMAFAAGGTVALAAGQVHAHDNQVRTYPAGAQSGGRDPGPHDPIREAENPDLVNPPATDSGTLPNLLYSFSDAHVRKGSGGWTRQVTQRELSISTTIAGVDMRLNAGGIRELHWHKEAEWAYMTYGTARVTAFDTQGGWFVDDIGVGDLWYFPAGIPHSIQGWDPTAVNFYWPLMMAISMRTARLCSPTGLSMFRLKFSPKTSSCRFLPSLSCRHRLTNTFSPVRCLTGLPAMLCRAAADQRCVLPTTCWHRIRLKRRAGRFASPTPLTFQ